MRNQTKKEKDCERCNRQGCAGDQCSCKCHKEVCESCNGKGWYTQFNQRVHKIACSDCNYQNKLKMKGVYKSVFESMASI